MVSSVLSLDEFMELGSGRDPITSANNYPSREICLPDYKVLEKTGCLGYLGIIKGNETYIFIYDSNNRAETLRVLGKFASNPESNFSWYDAALLSQQIRQNHINFYRKIRYNNIETIEKEGVDEVDIFKSMMPKVAA